MDVGGTEALGTVVGQVRYQGLCWAVCVADAAVGVIVALYAVPDWWLWPALAFVALMFVGALVGAQMLVTGIIGREAERADAYIESKWSSTFAKAFAVQVLVTTYGLELCTSLPACFFISSDPDFRTCMSSLNTSYDERFCSPRTTNGAWPDVDWHEFRAWSPDRADVRRRRVG